MEATAGRRIDPIGYLLAPLLAPTLNILFTPLWPLLQGRPGAASEALGWMVVAWFGLEAICLATLSPLLWLARHAIAGWPLPPSLSLGIAVLLSALASWWLFGIATSVFLSWMAAAGSAAFAFHAWQRRDALRQAGHKEL